jgi:hypothetical protein
MANINAVEAYHASNWLAQHNVRKMVAGTQDGEIWVSGNAAAEFSYTAFRSTLEYHTMVTETYYVNLANVNIKDPSDLTIGQDNMTWLYSSFSKIYDNGQVVILSANNATAP